VHAVAEVEGLGRLAGDDVPGVNAEVALLEHDGCEWQPVDLGGEPGVIEQVHGRAARLLVVILP
jgi:hypothetical protein